MNEYERIKNYLITGTSYPINPTVLHIALLALVEELARREREEQAEAQKMVGG